MDYWIVLVRHRRPFSSPVPSSLSTDRRRQTWAVSSVSPDRAARVCPCGHRWVERCSEYLAAPELATLLLLEVVRVDPLHVVGLSGRDRNVEVNHQFGEAVTIDEHDLRFNSLNVR